MASVIMASSSSCQMLQIQTKQTAIEITSSSSSPQLSFGVKASGHNISLRTRRNGTSLAATISPVDQPTAAAAKEEEEEDGVFVSSTATPESGEIKMKFQVSGAKAESIFDQVFSKMVAAAQPIPGFRRVKGGKTPNIPRDVLIQVLGPSKVYKQVITKVINSTVAEYVEKEKLNVTKDLKVEQSYDELEASFEPGEEFSFDVTLQLCKEEV